MVQSWFTEWQDRYKTREEYTESRKVNMREMKLRSIVIEDPLSFLGSADDERCFKGLGEIIAQPLRSVTASHRRRGWVHSFFFAETLNPITR